MNLMICEICGKTFNQNENDDLDVCYSCRSVKKSKIKTEKKPSSTLTNAIKRVIKGQSSKALKVRICGCSFERVVEDAEKIGQRLDNLNVNGIEIIVHQLSDKVQVTYINDNKIYSGYYQ